MLHITTFIFHQSSPKFLLKTQCFPTLDDTLMYQINEFSIFFFNFRFSILNNSLSGNLCNRLLEQQSGALTSLYLRLISLAFSWLVLLFSFAFSDVSLSSPPAEKRTNTINGTFIEIAIVISLSCFLFPYNNLECISIFVNSLFKCFIVFFFTGFAALFLFTYMCLFSFSFFFYVFYFLLFLLLLCGIQTSLSLCRLELFLKVQKNRIILIVLKKTIK